MAGPLMLESSRPTGGMPAIYITGMSSPIARAMMLDPELIETHEFHGTASNETSAQRLAAFMDEFDIAGTATVSYLNEPGAAGRWYETIPKRNYFSVFTSAV